MSMPATRDGVVCARTVHATIPVPVPPVPPLVPVVVPDPIVTSRPPRPSLPRPRLRLTGRAPRRATSMWAPVIVPFATLVTAQAPRLAGVPDGAGGTAPRPAHASGTAWPADTDSLRGLLCGETVGSGSQPACNGITPSCRFAVGGLRGEKARCGSTVSDKMTAGQTPE